MRRNSLIIEILPSLRATMKPPSGEHWFIAVLVFESGIEGAKPIPHGEGYEPSVDLQFRLIHATDSDTAYERAVACGEQAEHAYENPDGETCVWSLQGTEGSSGSDVG